MGDKDKLHPILESAIPLVEGLAATFGNNCEVVLHDFSRPQNSVVAIANGHITGRTISSPMTERGLKALRKNDFGENLIKYKTTTRNGRVLKSSTFFFRDEGKVIGCLCINLDITEFILAQKVIGQIAETMEDKNHEVEETYGSSVNEMLYQLVNKVFDHIEKPVAYLTKEQKVILVSQLDEMGVFLIKGSVEYVAEKLCVSRYTVYNYIDEVRANGIEK